jgi:hypothetical protein
MVKQFGEFHVGLIDGTKVPFPSDKPYTVCRTPAIIFSYPWGTDRHIWETKGVIYTGKADLYGNKSCDHYQIGGIELDPRLSYGVNAYWRGSAQANDCMIDQCVYKATHSGYRNEYGFLYILADRQDGSYWNGSYADINMLGHSWVSTHSWGRLPIVISLGSQYSTVSEYPVDVHCETYPNSSSVNAYWKNARLVSDITVDGYRFDIKYRIESDGIDAKRPIANDWKPYFDVCEISGRLLPESVHRVEFTYTFLVPHPYKDDDIVKEGESVSWTQHFADYDFGKVEYPTYSCKAGMKANDWCLSMISKYLPLIDHESRMVEYGDLTQTAADDVKSVDINTAVYIKELFELKDTIKDLWALRKGKNIPKTLSQLWLSNRYGLNLTVQDSEELKSAIQEALSCLYGDKRKTYARSIVEKSSNGIKWLEVQNCTLYYRNSDYAFKDAIKKSMDWDVFPTLQNVWDVVPFSFVVDWLVDVQGFLEDIDTRTYLSSVPTEDEIFSIKGKIPIPEHPGLTFEYYRRKVFPEPVLPTPSLGLSGDFTLKNGITALALILANR